MIELECRYSGSRRTLPVEDWSAPATVEELELLDGLRPAVLDVGCGPGRIAAALGARGVPALGIDTAPAALHSAMAVGAAVLQRSVWDRLPGEGRWGSVLLLDGNIGIGGDPVALLRRCGELLVSDGELLVEVGAAGTPTSMEEVRLCHPDDAPGPWFSWARVSLDGVDAIASAAGLCLRAVESRDGRHFAWVRARSPQRVRVSAAEVVRVGGHRVEPGSP